MIEIEPIYIWSLAIVISYTSMLSLKTLYYIYQDRKKKKVSEEVIEER